jgi:hypothetical protein
VVARSEVPADIGLTVGEAHLAFFIFALLEFLIPTSHAI